MLRPYGKDHKYTASTDHKGMYNRAQVMHHVSSPALNTLVFCLNCTGLALLYGGKQLATWKLTNNLRCHGNYNL